MNESTGGATRVLVVDDAATREIPIIFVSSLDDTASKVKAFTQGGVDYVTIPFHKEEILVRIKTHLNLRRMQQELKSVNKIFDDELRWAGEMQKALLRPKLNSTTGVEFRVSYQPVPGLFRGGDYYDVITLPEDRCLILTVAGHGVRAAFITGILKAIIYSEYVRNYIRTAFSPAAFLSWLNERMNFELRKTSGLLISFLAGVIDRRGMTFTYADITETLETGDIILTCTEG